MQVEAGLPGRPGRRAPMAVAIVAAVVGAAIAVGLRALAEPWAHHRIPYLTLYPVIVGITLWAGWIPGAVALAIGTAATALLYVDWSAEFATALISTVLMVIVGLALIALGNFQRCAAQRWQAAAADARRSAEDMRAS